MLPRQISQGANEALVLGSPLAQSPCFYQVCLLAFSLKRSSKIEGLQDGKAPSNLNLDLCKYGARPAMCKEIFVENGDFEQLITVVLLYC